MRQVISRHDLVTARESQPVGGMVGGVAAAPAREMPAAKPDAFQDRLLKYIPAEIVAVYVGIDGVLRASTNVPVLALQWAVFVTLLAGTWLYLARVQKVTKRQQLLISTIAFAVWVFSIGGPFASFPWYSPVYGAVLLPLYTFAVPIIEADA
jgi:hypothetical protein